MSVRNLDKLLRPTSIAVVGASDRPGSVGAIIVRNLRSAGFGGPVWAVNPNHAEIAGEKAWPDIASLPQAPELAVICSPAPTVPAVVQQLGEKGTRAAIVIGAGLKAPAAEGGATLEQRMLDAARPYTLRILGPNCIGLLVPGLGINASFGPAPARPGKIAFVTQSGALATAMLDWANGRGIGFSHFISLGDGADVDFGDVLDYLASDAGTTAILMYAESVRQGRKFMSAARAAARNKPVIVVKSGRAPEGAKAAASHTGALAGADAVFDAAVRRAGMLRVATLEALFDAAETLSHRFAWRGERLAILTNGGGAGVLAADALSLGGGTMAVLSASTLEALDGCLPTTWSRGNPIDIIGDAPASRYVDALRILLEAPQIDAVLFAHAPTAIVPSRDIAQACIPLARDATKPVLGCWLGGPSVAGAREAWSQAGLASFATPERAVDAWLQLANHAAHQALLQRVPPEPAEALPNTAQAQELLHAAVQMGREWLDEVQAKSLLEAYGIPTVETRMARSADEAAHMAASLGFPVALKVISPQVVHKSDVGGVRLNLQDEHAVRLAAIRMRQDLARRLPDAHVQGFAVERMVVRPAGRELIVGLASDPVFGPVVLCGSGGIDVELKCAHAVALPPLDDVLADDLVARAGLLPLLKASRGRPAGHMAALRDVLVKLARMASEMRGIAELDINPLLVDADGVIALDARVRVALPGGSPQAPPAIRPYPRQLETQLTIDGKVFAVRPIRPEDAPRLANFYAKASGEDLRLRFFVSRREVPRSELARYSQIDYDREMTLVAWAPDGAMAGEVRAVCDPDNVCAEFALQVAGEWQGKGLGTALLRRMVAYLQARGTRELVGTCLPENRAMAALARRMGMDMQQDDGAIRLRLVLPTA